MQFLTMKDILIKTLDFGIWFTEHHNKESVTERANGGQKT